MFVKSTLFASHQTFVEESCFRKKVINSIHKKKNGNTSIWQVMKLIAKLVHQLIRFCVLSRNNLILLCVFFLSLSSLYSCSVCYAFSFFIPFRWESDLKGEIQILKRRAEWARSSREYGKDAIKTLFTVESIIIKYGRDFNKGF